MMHDRIDNPDQKFGMSPQVYPVLIVGVNGPREMALFTQHEVRRAIKRARRFPELISAVCRKVEEEILASKQ